MKRIIITGGTGFIGANLTRRVLSDGNDVHLLVRPQHNPWRVEDIRPHVHIHEVTFEDKESLHKTLLDIKPDWIFHLAAHGAYSWQTDFQQMMQTNILGTVNLVESCVQIGFEAFVNTGSSSEYGYKDHAPSETESLEPNSHYDLSQPPRQRDDYSEGAASVSPGKLNKEAWLYYPVGPEPESFRVLAYGEDRYLVFCRTYRRQDMDSIQWYVEIVRDVSGCA